MASKNELAAKGFAPTLSSQMNSEGHDENIEFIDAEKQERERKRQLAEDKAEKELKAPKVTVGEKTNAQRLAFMASLQAEARKNENLTLESIAGQNQTRDFNAPKPKEENDSDSDY